MSGNRNIIYRSEQFLKKLFEKSGGELNHNIHAKVIGKELGMTEEESENIVMILKNKGYVKTIGTGPIISITTKGIEKVKGILLEPQNKEKPDSLTKHLKRNWITYIFLLIITVVGGFIVITYGEDVKQFLKPDKAIKNVLDHALSDTDIFSFKGDKNVISDIPKLGKKDSSIYVHKEDTLFTPLEDKKESSTKTSQEKQTKATTKKASLQKQDYVTISGHKYPAGAIEVWHDVIVELDSIQPHVAPLLRPGTKEYNENGQITWKIEKIIASQPSYYVAGPLKNGKRTFIGHPEKRNIKCLMKLKVVLVGDVLYYKNKHLFIEDTLKFKSSHFSITGRLINILY